MVLAGRPGKEVPMSEQAARKPEALKEAVRPHQPGQAEFRAILAEDIFESRLGAFLGRFTRKRSLPSCLYLRGSEDGSETGTSRGSLDQ